MDPNPTGSKPHDETYDFFVSYARSDNVNDWITRFIEELQAEHQRFTCGAGKPEPQRKLKPFFDQHAITNGADWQLYLAHGIAHSRLFLAFLSPNYFASEWCRKEWRAWMDAEIAQHILTAGARPIYIIEVPGLTGKGQLSDQQLAQQLAELSKLPESDRTKLITETSMVVKHLRRRQLTHNQPFCDIHAFFDAGLDALRSEDLRQVLEQLAHDLDHHTALLAQADVSLSTVPAYNKNFTGRLDELLLLRECLIKDDRTGVIYGIQGLGGLGKTELALTYAHAYASAYPGGRFLIRCESKNVLRNAVLGQSDFIGLFGDLISDEERKLPDAYFAAILRCLRTRLNQIGHVLLVLDNVSDLALLGHQQTQALTALGRKLHLLATTRLIPPAGGKSNWLSLGQLPDDDALYLLEKYRPINTAAEHEAAGRIIKRLGGFTLAVELAAAHLAEHPDVTCASMADIIGLEDLENLDVIKSADRQNIRYEHDRRLSAVLGPTLVALAPAERRALEYAALLPPDHVPLPWLKTLVVADFPEIGQPTRLTDPWNDLWRRLEQLALFTRSEEETSEPCIMRVHRLVQDIVRYSLIGNTELLLGTIVLHAWLRSDMLSESWQNRGCQWEIEPLTRFVQYTLDCRRHDSLRLVQVICRWLPNVDLSDTPLSFLRESIRLEDACISLQDRIMTRNALGWALRQRGLLSDAERTLRDAVLLGQSDECYPGLEHATSLNNLGKVMLDQRRFKEALPLFHGALTAYRASQNIYIVTIATILNNIGDCLIALGDLKEAESSILEGLSLRSEQLGEGHPYVAVSHTSLARLHLANDRYRDASQHAELAVNILTSSTCGTDHIRTANAMQIRAEAARFLGNAEIAATIFQEVFRIRSRLLPQGHPDIEQTLSCLSEINTGETTNEL